MPKNAAPEPPATPPLAVWREVTENRVLKTTLKPKEIEECSQELARTVGEIARLDDDKKASASRYKGMIEEKQARQGHLATLIRDKWEDRSQKCKWEFECAGKDADGALIFHPEKKALIRIDSGEVVEVVTMTEQDQQNRELPLGEAQPPADEEESE